MPTLWVTTTGSTEGDLDALRAQEGVDEADRVTSFTMIHPRDGETSGALSATTMSPSGVDVPITVDGAPIDQADEGGVWIDVRYAESNGIAVRDSLPVEIGAASGRAGGARPRRPPRRHRLHRPGSRVARVDRLRPGGRDARDGQGARHPGSRRSGARDRRRARERRGGRRLRRSRRVGEGSRPQRVRRPRVRPRRPAAGAVAHVLGAVRARRRPGDVQLGPQARGAAAQRHRRLPCDRPLDDRRRALLLRDRGRRRGSRSARRTRAGAGPGALRHRDAMAGVRPRLVGSRLRLDGGGRRPRSRHRRRPRARGRHRDRRGGSHPPRRCSRFSADHPGWRRHFAGRSSRSWVMARAGRSATRSATPAASRWGSSRAPAA